MAHFTITRKSDNIVLSVIAVPNSYIEERITTQAKPEPIITIVDNEKKGIEHLKRVFEANKGFTTIMKEDGKSFYHLDEVEFNQTSYNGNIRRRYAAIGYTMDRNRDAFIRPIPKEAPCKVQLDPTLKGTTALEKELGTWYLDESKCDWAFKKEATTIRESFRQAISKVSNIFSKPEVIIDPNIVLPLPEPKITKLSWWKRLKIFIKKLIT